MMDNFFKMALVVSITVHSFAIFGIPDIFPQKSQIPKDDIEIAYVEIQKMQAQISQAKKKLMEIQKNQNTQNTGAQSTQAQAVDQKKVDKKNAYEMAKKYRSAKKSEDYAYKKPQSQREVSLDRNITVREDLLADNYTSFATKLMQKESYTDYYQILRSRIRAFAAGNYPSGARYGDIAVSFVLFCDGRLKSINIVDDKSSSDYKLRFAAVKSIKEAAPFPPFPGEFEDMNIAELAFHIVISFKLKK